MRTNLQRNPRVIRIASALSADRLRVIGGLHAVWSLADEQTEDGRLDAYSFQTIDEMIGWSGFCKALSDVDWISEDERGVVFPRFDEHNGASAKRRAQEADRKRSARSSAKESASNADKKRTREEKRREDIKTPLPPSGAFEAFWTAWPKGERKQAKGKCSDLWRQKSFDEQAEVILAHVARLKESEGWRNGFICAPLVYLNQRRWEGAEEGEAMERNRREPGLRGLVQ